MSFSFHSFIFCKGIPSLPTLGMTLIFSFFTSFSLAQNTFTSTQLLSEKVENTSSQLLENNIDFLESTPQQMPLVDKLELRTETDEFNYKRQEYLFRMSFNGKKSRQSQNLLTSNLSQVYQLQSEILDASILSKRYEQIMDWYYTDLEIEQLQKRKIILEDKKTIYQKMIANTEVINIDNLLKTEESIQEITQLILQLNLGRNFAIKQLLNTNKLPDSITLSKSNWISLTKMQEVLASSNALASANPNEVLQIAKVNTARLEYKREKAEGQKILDFVQLKYAGRDNLEFQREWSFGMGINLPTKFSSRVKLNEAQLEIFDEQFKQQLLKENIQRKIARLETQFQNLIASHQLIQSQVETNQLQNTFDNYAKVGEVHPLTLLRIKESILKSEKKLQKIEMEACSNFIELLALKGMLTQAPRVNYLSDNLQSL